MTIENQSHDASPLNRESSIVNRKCVEVSAALIFHGGKLLITQRHAHSHLGGLWEFPGGKREAGETFEQCLAREIREELGVQVAVGKLFQTLRHDYPEKSVLLNFFLCGIITGEPQPLDCAAVKWVGAEELADYSFPAADEQLLAALRSPSCATLWVA